MRGVMVAPAVEAPVVIGLDVGGTKILSGLVDREGNVLAEHEVRSPGESEEDVLAALDAAVEALLDDRVAAIGYGIPANLERGTGRILHAMNLPLDERRSRSRGRRSASACRSASRTTRARRRSPSGGAGRDEARRTSSCSRSEPASAAGSSLDGRLFRGWAELGHIVVQEGGAECTCGGHGHLEVLASGHAGDRAARELYGAGRRRARADRAGARGRRRGCARGARADRRARSGPPSARS